MSSRTKGSYCVKHNCKSHCASQNKKNNHYLDLHRLLIGSRSQHVMKCSGSSDAAAAAGSKSRCCCVCIPCTSNVEDSSLTWPKVKSDAAVNLLWFRQHADRLLRLGNSMDFSAGVVESMD